MGSSSGRGTIYNVRSKASDLKFILRDIFIFSIITEICYYFLEKSSIKSDKEIVSDIFNLFGTLLTEYRYSAGFVFRIAELVKSHDHTVLFVSQGIKLLVESYNAKGLVREFVKQITEWQTDEKLQNAEVLFYFICEIVISIRFVYLNCEF